MTTTSEYLLSKSTLTSGTALEHFCSMQSGNGAVVYAPRFSVFSAVKKTLISGSAEVSDGQIVTNRRESKVSSQGKSTHITTAIAACGITTHKACTFVVTGFEEVTV